MRPVTRTTRGFTLIELLVSIALFSIVATIVAAAYLNLINLDRRTRATNDLVDNMNFVLDTMERSARTGTNFQVVTGANSFTFTDQNNCAITFYKNSGQINERNACAGTDDAITDSRITITALSFTSTGISSSDSLEPQVTMLIRGSITPDPSQLPITFSIETSATERGIDI